MAKKQYSNVYTVLDKARKGELEFENSGSLFKSVAPYKRPDIIRPRVHYLDEMVINRFVNNHINDPKFYNKMQQKLAGMGYGLSVNQVADEVRELLYKFPKGLKNDIFNLFNKDINSLDFEERGDNNKMRYKFIEKANQPVHKIMTIDSNMKSLVFTQHVMEYFITSMYLMKLKEPEKMEQMQQQMQQESENCQQPSSSGGGNGQFQLQQQQPSDQGNDKQTQGQNDPSQQQQDPSDRSPQDSQNDSSNDGGGDKSSKGNGNTQKEMTPDQMEKALQKMLDKQDAELEKLMDQANQLCNKLDETYDRESLDEMWEDAQDGKLSATSLDAGQIESMAQQLRDMRMSMRSVTEFIKKIMDKSVNYFSGREDVRYESMMENGHLDGVDEVYMLHPKLRKFMVEDIMVKDVKKIGKINIYIDVSGSMSATCGARTENGKYISRLDFAKAFALKMLDMDLLNKVFTFNDNVKSRNTTMADILKVNCSGGTYTEKVIQHIIQTDENAIIVTDGTDHVASYTHKAYFIGTQGATFTGYAHLDKYKDQMCVFDGQRIQRINDQGYPY